MQLTFSLDFMDTTSSDLQDLNFLKASEALSDSNGADVSHSRRQEAVNIPDAKQSSDTSGIKHELKNVIKSRRLAKGLDDLQLPTNSADHKPTTEELTEEEEEKRRLRRERNKVAASKCRERKKLKMERLSQEAEDLKEENTALTTDIRGLQQEKDNLISKLRNHHCVLTATSLNSTYDIRQEENEKVLE